MSDLRLRPVTPVQGFGPSGRCDSGTCRFPERSSHTLPRAKGESVVGSAHAQRTDRGEIDALVEGVALRHGALAGRSEAKCR